MDKPKVLLVDDEADIIRSLTIRLRAAGYDVVAAMDAFQATQTAMESQPDIIILDLGIPAGGGHMVIQRLQGSSKTCSIPIIILSARCDADNKALAKSEGASIYITKPYKADDVLAAIAELIGPLAKPAGQVG